MLKLNDIRVTLNKTSCVPYTVLNNLNLAVADGEFVIIVGNNGCGKSTLFNTIAGHIQPDHGSVIINGQDVTTQTSAQRANMVALVMQEPRMGTIANMTIEENLSIAYKRGHIRTLRLHNTAQRRSLFKDHLAMLGMNLENRLDTLVGNLSGGQSQALSLIMAIIADYKILLLDEITAALDPNAADTIMDISAKLVKEQQRTAIMITHNMEYALGYGDRTLLMMRGKEFCEYNAAARKSLSPACLAAALI